MQATEGMYPQVQPSNFKAVARNTEHKGGQPPPPGCLLKQAGHAMCAQACRRASKSRKRYSGPMFDEAAIIDSKVSTCLIRPVHLTNLRSSSCCFLRVQHTLPQALVLVRAFMHSRPRHEVWCRKCYLLASSTVVMECLAALSLFPNVSSALKNVVRTSAKESSMSASSKCFPCSHIMKVCLSHAVRLRWINRSTSFQAVAPQQMPS